MKTRIKMSAGIVVIGLVFTSMSGCSNRGAPVKAPEAPAAPAGFINLKDVRGNIPAGTSLYKRDGTVVGTVVAYDATHEFADGDKGAGVQVQSANGGNPQWTPVELIGNSVFIKK